MSGIPKRQLLKQKEGIDMESPCSQLHMALLTLNFSIFSNDSYAPFEWHSPKNCTITQNIAFGYVEISSIRPMERSRQIINIGA
jgi:hypothetical protein